MMSNTEQDLINQLYALQDELSVIREENKALEQENQQLREIIEREERIIRNLYHSAGVVKKLRKDLKKIINGQSLNPEK